MKTKGRVLSDGKVLGRDRNASTWVESALKEPWGAGRGHKMKKATDCPYILLDTHSRLPSLGLLLVLWKLRLDLLSLETHYAVVRRK